MKWLDIVLKSPGLDRSGQRATSLEEQPLRTELLSLDQLQEHARKLAGWHQVVAATHPDRLLGRLDENSRVIAATYRDLSHRVDDQDRITAAEDWLLDNYHVIDAQIRMARKHLPRSYSRQLPELSGGPMAGYPRVYDIALELIAHSDGVIDRENLHRFILGYQQVETLEIGEIWAIPIMLRLALLDNLRRVAARLRWTRQHQEKAEHWAKRILSTAGEQPGRVVIDVADMARQEVELNAAFVPALVRRLQSRGPGTAQVLTWIEQQLSERGQSIHQISQYASDMEAADQIAIGNSISSLRALSGMDWRRFVESSSTVEKTLRSDPSETYAAMDFESRDRCRHVIETIARKARRPENEVAELAVQLAREADKQKLPATDGALAGEVTYYLLDEGLRLLRAACDLPPRWHERMGLQRVHLMLAGYLGGIATMNTALAVAVACWVYAYGAGWFTLITLTAVAALATSSLAVTLVNLMVTRLSRPQRVPRLDFRRGIAREHRTVVAVPTLIAGQRDIDHLVEDMEVRFLANRDDNLCFVLLSDFPDARQQVLDSDAKLLAHMGEAIAALNRRHLNKNGPIFYALHRPRRWNEQEKCWMAWERKRGKLMQFNELLRSGETDAFCYLTDEVTALVGTRYVIPLDTDTQLPRDAARQMVAAMAHPLNQPRLDPQTRRVVRGYAILQPRVSNGLEGANSSRYASLMSGEPGVDPYTREVSDVYQDLFGEGSFIGKGIYDVAAFETALGDRFPDNQLLSHDLIESCYARSGLLGDVQLVEDYPSGCLADLSRQHRWVRGDWQQWPWLLPKAPDRQRRWIHNPIRPLGRWKLLDNMRRSLVPPAVVALLILGWLLAPQLAPAWLILLAALYIGPGLMQGWMTLVSFGGDASLQRHLWQVVRHLGRAAVQAVVQLLLLPTEAWNNFDATARSIGQMLGNGRGMMQWRTSSETARSSRRDLPGHMRAMPAQILLGAALIAAALITPHPLAALLAVVLGSGWLAAPALAWWLSQPLKPKTESLSSTQRLFLRRVARRTWRYFELFVNEQTNHLPPDNYQETGDFGLDARTSPTNLGVAALCHLTAVDLGYQSVGVMIDRYTRLFASMAKLERHRGHFYNWYDTRTLATLPPFYVSAVDSGNLAGHLLVSESGLRGLARGSLVPAQLLDGLCDTLAVAHEVAEAEKQAALTDALACLKDALDRRHLPSGLRQTGALLTAVACDVREVCQQQQAALDDQSESAWWLAAIARQADQAREDFFHLAPHVALLLDADDDPACLPPDDPALQQMLEAFNSTTSLPETARWAIQWQAWKEQHATLWQRDQARRWLDGFEAALTQASEHAAERIAQLETLAEQAAELADMDFRAVYDTDRQLLRIGLHVSEHQPDPSHYDLLASEARLASYLAIATGQVPQEHWFHLSRTLTMSDGHKALVSWSGSMFEYLMPNLIMPGYERTLLHETNRAVVRRQIQYGRQRSVPWGISESSYAAIDAGGHYQYQAFGVPGLGLKRGLSSDLVIAPYATALGAMLLPATAAENLHRLIDEGAMGRCGFYEAIDYTRDRVPNGQRNRPTRLYMVHHSGMAMVALAQVLLDAPMHQRFLAHPVLSAARLLLQEKVPQDLEPVYPHAAETHPRRANQAAPATIRAFSSPHTNWPRVHLLSNGRYHVMLSNSGGGYSRWNDLAVTRFQEDRTCDDAGQFIYLRDLDEDQLWSIGFQPCAVESKRYEAIFSQGRVEYRRHDHEMLAHLSVSVSPEDDLEVRRLTLSNQSGRARRMQVTSYGEIVLSTPEADAAHPAFGKLFVQTHIVNRWQAILASRRPRESGQNPPWLFHQMHISQGRVRGQATYETDRSRFIGRGRTAASPQALEHDRLDNTEGSVLDPVFAIQRTVRLEPGQRVVIDIITGMAQSREQAMAQVAKYADHHFADRVFDIAPARSQLTLQHLGASEANAQLYSQLATAILHGNPAFRAQGSILRSNRLGQAALWRYGISGDLPIVLLTIASGQHLELAAQAIKAHAYWRSKGLAVDLILINDDFSGYRQDLHESLQGLIQSGPSSGLLDKPGGIFLRRGDQISAEDRTLLQSVARIVLDDAAGDLLDQSDRQGRARPATARLTPTLPPWKQSSSGAERRDLMFYNGYGGFTRDGHEYITSLAHGQSTPAPWSNVLANDRFGCVISESGGCYTWFENAHEFRLTPWHNDPVTDRCGEALYIRDDQTGQYWSPTPRPAPGQAPYATRHGFGYTIFEHEEGEIRSELTTFVATDVPLRYLVLKLRNTGNRTRRLSVAAIFEWVLAEHRSKGAMHVVTELDARTGALMARNWYNSDFPGRVAFVHTPSASRTVTGDRGEFIGRNRNLSNPQAMEHTELSGRLGAGLDPCAAMMTSLELAQGQEQEVVFMIGAGASEAEARQVLIRHGGRNAHRRSLENVWQMWNRILGTVHVETPDPAVNMLVNGWLVYQTLACRIWARSGYYQSGGAFGFRDQLQDCMALLHAAPWIYRGHLLHACEHQFLEGDVQHWWHPPTNRGVRTRIRDDYLWLPAAVARYVRATGDNGLLDEKRPYLMARPLAEGEESCYDLPVISEEQGTVYEHCVRAIEYGLAFGAHGLPLIGSGDWNDGMDKVGPEGRGESVWLAFFLYDVLMQFAPVAEGRGEKDFARQCRDQAATLRGNIEKHAWDGQWYRRAYFDDGSPLGSKENPECQIDAIPQAWAVISGAGDPQRTQQAMQSVNERLVRRDIGIIQLFTPPFDKSALEPGYIKGYVPGVRENGGQYTHAASWVTMAYAMLGDAARAWECFELISPVRHGGSPEAIETYKVEPYVVAADVYGVAPHEGRGGWTWYTGSAGWIQRLLVETILGLTLEVDTLRFAPCLPPDWDGFRMHYRYRDTFYHIHVVADPGHANHVAEMTCDGQSCQDGRIRLLDDQLDHRVQIRLAGKPGT